jgi:hypothetical protein
MLDYVGSLCKWEHICVGAERRDVISSSYERKRDNIEPPFNSSAVQQFRTQIFELCLSGRMAKKRNVYNFLCGRNVLGIIHLEDGVER